MKARKRVRKKTGKAGRYYSEEARQRSLANLSPPWRPGQSGNPNGRPVGSGSGLGSIVNHLKRRLKGKAVHRRGQSIKYQDLADELAAIMVRHARKGKFAFLQEIIKQTESAQLTEAEMADIVERVYASVKKHVERLQGGMEALEQISLDLQEELTDDT